MPSFAPLFVLPLLLAAAPASVVDLHNLSGHDRVSRKGERWVVTSVVDEELPITVDLKNGYLEWSDEGTGGGTRIVQSALFRTADKRSLLVSRSSIEDGTGGGGQVSVHEHRDGKMVPADGVLPRLGPEAFLLESVDAKTRALRKDWLERMDVNYSLPRVGTSIVATLDQARARFELAKLSEAERAEVERFLAQGFYATVELAFDKKKGTFAVGKKARRK